MRKIFVVLAISSVVSTVAFAQQDTTTVPRELALALIDPGFAPPGTPPIIVGRAPKGFPTDLLPKDVKVLGSLSRVTKRDTPISLTVIAVGPDSVSAASANLQPALERSGWKAPPMPESRGGFVLSGPGNMPGWTLCRDSTALWVHVGPRDRGGSLYRFVFTPSTQRYSICNPENLRRAEAFQQHEGFTFPTLRAPWPSS